MKRIFAILLLLAFATVIFAGCKSEEQKRREAAQELNKKITNIPEDKKQEMEKRLEERKKSYGNQKDKTSN